jgi:hypothetical protein
LCTQCAQITPLTGGKKDTTPPKVMLCNPQNVSLNFISKTIEIEFDEYIALKDIANQFIITPQTKEMPDIQSSGKKVKIIFNETLLPNVTYKLAFGNAICDINESNILQNFEYIFSTGQTIDSLKLNGQISNAFNKKPSSNILVGLYDVSSNDSVIYKEKPLYITKTSSEGNFKFDYLPNKLFKIVGINDQNKNLLYDGSDEEIAFEKNKVNPTENSAIQMLLFKEVAAKSFIKKATSLEYGKAYVVFNKPQLAIKDVKANGLMYYKQSISKDSLVLYYTNKFDTLQTYISYESKKTDTVDITILSKSLVEKQLKAKAIKYQLQSNLTSVMPYFSLPQFTLNVSVNSKNINAIQFILTEKRDTVLKKIPFTIIKENDWITDFKIQAQFVPETNYTLTILKQAISDDLQRTNDSLSYQFSTTSLEDYSQLKMKLFFPKKENYIVLLLNDKSQIVSEDCVEFSLTSTSEKIIEYEKLIPGNYFLKVVEDANKNRRFDTGDYFLSTQPESVFFNATPIKLLAGWKIENEWIVK